MKVYSCIKISAFLIIFLVISGCKIDVSESQHELTNLNPPTPKINQIDPATSAQAGVNIITIHGENFINVPLSVGVYFNDLRNDIDLRGEIIERSETTIKVRRPNIVSDSCVIRVIPNGTYKPAVSNPYIIVSVVERYGDFLDNAELSTVTADDLGNIYVVETLSKMIFKVTPDGENTSLGTVTRAPTDAILGPDNRLYLLENHREMQVADLEAGTVSRWEIIPRGDNVKFGDFDTEGYFYTGGPRPLTILAPDGNFIDPGLYTSEEILAIRIYNSYMYIAARTDVNDSTSVIYRHQLTGSGTIGPQELILDFESDPNLIDLGAITSLALASDGRLFVVTDSPNPMLYIDVTTKQWDFFYKSIIPSYCKQISWGSNNMLYLISGNTAPAQEWTVYQVNTGITEAIK